MCACRQNLQQERSLDRRPITKGQGKRESLLLGQATTASAAEGEGDAGNVSTLCTVECKEEKSQLRDEFERLKEQTKRDLHPITLTSLRSLLLPFSFSAEEKGNTTNHKPSNQRPDPRPGGNMPGRVVLFNPRHPLRRERKKDLPFIYHAAP